MSQLFAVVYEADADFQIATDLADRVLQESVEWLEESHVEHVRAWVSHAADGQPLTWSRIKQLARDAGISVAGHLEDQTAFSDAKAARRALLYLEKTMEDLNGIVLVRDQDDQPERRLGLEQACAQHHGNPPVVIGLAVIEREAWVLAGFEPQDRAEQARLDAERQKLGFQPHENSQQLTASKDDQATRSPKRVLRALTGGDAQREAVCWLETSLETLKRRGQENGLAVYLEEVRKYLAPLIGHLPHPGETS